MREADPEGQIERREGGEDEILAKEVTYTLRDLGEEFKAEADWIVV